MTQSPPAPKWTTAVEQARQIVRAGLAKQNLPGLSVAVGIGGDSLGGMVASLLTFPDLVVAVTSNISYADTFSLAEKVAQAFRK